MSTRGWYQYWVVDDCKKQVSLSMQFYKWGDAEPENVLAEFAELERATNTLGSRIPVELAQQLLVDNLGEAFALLPPSFPIGCYYFLLQRAAEEEQQLLWSPTLRSMPKEERPDYRLGYAVGRASAETGLDIPGHADAVIGEAHFAIAVGLLVRRWTDCSARMPFLRWLQYITQLTEKIEMGSIAGDYQMPWDVSYLHRFFFRIPDLVNAQQPIDSIELELCHPSGGDLRRVLLDQIERADSRDREGLVAAYEAVLPQLNRADRVRCSLEAVLQTHEMVRSAFWDRRLPRNGYLGP